MGALAEGQQKKATSRAIAAYHYLSGLGVPGNRIIAYGESLGSGQAVRLAAARPVAAVVLEAPLTSTLDVARTTYFWLPLDLLITDTYSNIRSVSAPVLILHGERDAVIPEEMGWRVYRAANERSGSNCFPVAPMTIYSTMAPGTRHTPFSLRWVGSVSARKRKWADDSRTLI
jgi:fermentation-respiration switch protein FrsA (DUF1100 family)